MDDTITCYDRVLGRITNSILPDGPLRESAEAALKLDALDLRLRSWKYEFDQTTSGDFREQHRDTFERLVKQAAQVFETLEPLLGLVEDCANRAPRTMVSLLPLLEAETDKLNEVERELDDPIDVTLSTEPASRPQDSDDIYSGSESDFDLSWRPDDYDSPDFMNRLLHIDRSDLVSETLRAATLGHSKTLESLLARPQWAGLLSAVDNNGDTALQIAESRGHEEVVQKILSKQAASPRVETTTAPAASRPDSPRSNPVDLPPVEVEGLRREIESAEHFACVLQALRDEMPPGPQRLRKLVDITSAIGELYRLSTVFQQLCSAFDAPHYADRLYRISSDAALVVNSAKLTLSVALGMVGRASPATQWMVWDDMSHRLQDVERVPLAMRLKWYYYFTGGLLGQLEGFRPDDTLARLKASIQELQRQQLDVSLQRPLISPYRTGHSSSNTPKPSIAIRSSPRPDQSQARTEPNHGLPPRVTWATQSMSSASSSTSTMSARPQPRPRHPVSDYSGTPRPNAPPLAPEISSSWRPTVTGSSHTYVGSDNTRSKQGPDSGYDATSTHWASKIFVDVAWRSQYRAGKQSEAVTRCKGEVQPDAKLTLQEDGFVPLASVHFLNKKSKLTFYWRPQNGRARILFTSVNTWGQEVEHCNPLTRLRAFRDGSVLRLSMRAKSNDHLFWNWAELKSIYHERMVLFYSTFVALKRQDPAGLPTALVEDPRDMQEELLFSGTIRDREMFHVLRLLQDRGSGVLRLEARPCRGDRDEVPIWTAFLTKYKDNRDCDIFNLESRGIVSMICPKPKPYIFVPEYGLPLTPDGDFALQFVKRDDASLLVEIWIGLCTSGRRS